MRSGSRQLPIDALKCIASQAIVLHHLLAYGPISDAIVQMAPELMAWLFDHSRMAVHIFLVLGGYLAAQTLSPSGLGLKGPLLPSLCWRYLRLVLPYLVVLVLAVISAALARLWLHADFIPAAPSPGQLLAHGLLLQGVLGFDSLSAGVWYIAIDFQLFVLLGLLLYLGQNLPTSRLNPSTSNPNPDRGWGLVLLLTLASLFVFNRNDYWDNWGLYFFASYGMGAAAYWVGCPGRPVWLLTVMALAAGLALALDFRARLLLALATALYLAWLRWRNATRPIEQLPPPVTTLARGLRFMGEISYPLFLLHFPVLMLGNTLYFRLGLSSPGLAILFLLASWVTSVALAALFQRRVEIPLGRLRLLRR